MEDLTGREPRFGRVPKLVRIDKASELEGGSFWPALRLRASSPDYQCMRYQVLERVPSALEGPRLSLRGAASVDALELAIIADRFAATLTVTDAGLPDYCLTMVRQGGLTATGAGGAGELRVGRNTGLIYRGRPGTRLVATGSHERVAVWIPAGLLRARLAGLLDQPVLQDVEFQPVFDWDTAATRSLGSLLRTLMSEFGEGSGVLTLDIAARSFADLFLYTLLRAVPHSLTDRLERPVARVLPATVRRAEAFIDANVEEPLALHDVARAAGCSVRSLQTAFRTFRDTTPLLAMRDARLRATYAALTAPEPGTTVTEVAFRFGFSNPGRFAGQFRRAFGSSPADILRRSGR